MKTISKRIVDALERIENTKSLLAPQTGLNVATGYLLEALELRGRIELHEVAAAFECGAKYAEIYADRLTPNAPAAEVAEGK